jgi:hypothetical protein
MSDREQLAWQIDRLVASSVLHNSESLCKLLRYLAKHAAEHAGTPLKEYTIATEVFGRPSDFDPHLDSTIRVQASRLRAKLAEYYAAEGAEDPVVVELPKGSYVLAFHTRPHAGARAHSAGSPVSDTETVEVHGSRKRMVVTVALALLLAALVALAFYFSRNRGGELAQTSATEAPPPALAEFWKSFLTGPEEPLVIYSNAAFVGRPEIGLRYYDPSRDSKDLIFDHYTGVGEVLAVHNLDRLFGIFHRTIVVKRGSLFTLDDANNNDLIFVGSPSENLSLQELPATKDFVFRRLTSGPRKGDLAIVNVHPEKGEQEAFLASPSTQPLTEDYAVVAFTPGLNPAHSLMLLAGTTTFGTQGAAEYVCREQSVQELLLRLSVSTAGTLKPFEAVIHVKVIRGVPVETQLAALRERSS